MAGMVRFSLRAALFGLTLAAVGLGMFAIGLSNSGKSPPGDAIFVNAFLVAFGGVLVGYGVSFPVKWPPHRMMFPLMGLFAAQACASSNWGELLVYAGMMAPIVGVSELARRKIFSQK